MLWLLKPLAPPIIHSAWIDNLQVLPHQLVLPTRSLQHQSMVLHTPVNSRAYGGHVRIVQHHLGDHLRPEQLVKTGVLDYLTVGPGLHSRDKLEETKIDKFVSRHFQTDILPLDFLLSHSDDKVITTNSLHKNLVASIGIVLTRNVSKYQVIRDNFENRFNLPQKLEVEHYQRTILDYIVHFLQDTNRPGILCPR